jgi:very-short-patch-repair endonuclease
VELDGSQHSAESDADRTRFLEAQGVRVLRFWNNDVLMCTTAVLEAILDAVENRTLTPTPLPGERG